MLIYITIDVASPLALGLELFAHFAESSASSDIYVQPSGPWTTLMAAFFLLIAFANVRLCVLPAIEARSAKSAMASGALLRRYRLRDAGLTNTWSIGSFPLASALTIMLEGCILSRATSGLTAWLNLRSISGAP